MVEKTSDTLTTGAERLAGDIMHDAFERDQSMPLSEVIASDPGVKALVEFVHAMATGQSAYWSVSATAALKLWKGDP